MSTRRDREPAVVGATRDRPPLFQLRNGDAYPRSTASHFYKYSRASDLERLKRILLHHQLYVPTASQLNDPADARPQLELPSKRELVRFLVSLDVSGRVDVSLSERAARIAEKMMFVEPIDNARLLEETANTLNEHIGRLRIYSMSKRWDNFNLWEHYAANHAGYCLEFQNAGFFSEARDITYGDLIKLSVIAKPDDVGVAFVFRKRRDYSGEEEVRLIGHANTPAIVSFDPTLLTRIILGRNISTDDRYTIIEWATKRRRPPLSVFQARYDNLTHNLELVSLT